jgi:hypothetical protein
VGDDWEKVYKIIILIDNTAISCNNPINMANEHYHDIRVNLLTGDLLTQAYRNAYQADDLPQEVVPMLSEIVTVVTETSNTEPVPQTPIQKIDDFYNITQEGGFLGPQQKLVFQVARAIAQVAQNSSQENPPEVQFFQGNPDAPAIPIIRTLLGIDESKVLDVNVGQSNSKFRGIASPITLAMQRKIPNTDIITNEYLTAYPRAATTQSNDIFTLKARIPGNNPMRGTEPQAPPRAA